MRIPVPNRTFPLLRMHRCLTPRSMDYFTHQILRTWVQALLLLAFASLAHADTPDPAITTFNKWCFKAGQTEAQARTNMNADTAAFKLTFWDDSLEPRPANAPIGIERRCEIAFDGDHAAPAITALRIQMAIPPKLGTPIPLPATHKTGAATVLIEGRKLLRGRVAVVHVGTREIDGKMQTFMAVDRLYAGLGLPEGT